VQAAVEGLWARWSGSVSAVSCGIWAGVCDAKARVQIKIINGAMQRRIGEPFFWIRTEI
jgi:hypothetical protein